MIEAHERFGKLEVLGPITDYYRLKCWKCGSVHIVATGTALRSGLLTACSDCTALANMTPAQRAVMAFKKKLDLSPEWEVGYVDALPAKSSPLTIAQALAA